MSDTGTMRSLAIAFILACGSIQAQSPEPVVIESISEVFVGFIRADGTAVAGPLKDFQPSKPTVYVCPPD